MVSESLELSNSLKTKRLNAHVLPERNLVQTSPHSTLFSPNWVEVSECHPNVLQRSSTTSILSAHAELSAWRDHRLPAHCLITTDSARARLTRLPRWPFRCTMILPLCFPPTRKRPLYLHDFLPLWKLVQSGSTTFFFFYWEWIRT